MNMSKSARKFLRDEIELMIRKFEAQYNVKITTEKLKEANMTSNEIKKRLQKAAALRATKDIPNADYFNLVISCLITEKEKCIADLDKTIADWEGRAAFPADKKRILLTMLLYFE